MANDETILEELPPHAQVGTTRHRLPTTVLEEGVGGAAGHTIELAQGGVICGHRVESRLAVRSGEADLWLVRPVGGGALRILKLYRFGVRPKQQILERLRRLRPEHVVELVDYGEQDGRHFEIQEYVPHGTLADMMEKGRLEESVQLEILAQVRDALVHLQEFQVLHRDVKPSNILVRRIEPLDLVLTDFGISSVADFSIHLTSVSRTAAYCAPEAVTGVVSVASDWWSVGVIMLELVTGRHPFAGLNEQVINHLLASRGLPVPSDVSPGWQLLLRGLLTFDYRVRWGAAEVTRWLAGDRSIPVQASTVSGAALPAHRPYRFEGRDYWDSAGLAEGFVLNWPEAAKHLALGYVGRWVEQDLRDQALALRMREILGDPDLKPEHRLPVVLLAMHSGIPMAVQGVILDESVCVSSPEVAQTIANSSLGRWLDRLRGDPWLARWSEDYRSVAAFVTSEGIPIRLSSLPTLLAASEAMLTERVEALRRQFPGARHPRLDGLLKQCDLNRAERVLLLATETSQFLTPAELEAEQLLDQVRHRGWRIDEHFARQLLGDRRWLALAPRWILARRHAEERAKTPLRLTHEDMSKLLSQPVVDPFDAIAVLANRLEFENSLQMRFVPIPATRRLVSVWLTRVRDFSAALRDLALPHKEPHFAQGPDHPVVWVSHADAEAYCGWLTARERAAGIIGPQDAYRLPTDLEWSRLAGLDKEPGTSPRERNGRVPGVYPWGTAWPPAAEVARVCLDPEKALKLGTSPVNMLRCNEFGLSELGWHVMEWCADRYDEDIELFVARGGSWCHSTPENFEVSARRRFVNRHMSENLGFRCVLEFQLPPDLPPMAQVRPEVALVPDSAPNRDTTQPPASKPFWRLH